MRFTISFFLLLTLSSCASGPYRFYDGRQKPIDEVAVITTDFGALGGFKPFEKSEFVRLMAIDDVKGKNGKWGYHSKWDNSLNVSLLPGVHKLTITYTALKSEIGKLTTTKSLKPYDVNINFKKGHNYLLSFKTYGISWTPIIYNKTTNKQIYPANKK